MNAQEVAEWIDRRFGDRIRMVNKRWTLDAVRIAAPELWVNHIYPLLVEEGLSVSFPQNEPQIHIALQKFRWHQFTKAGDPTNMIEEGVNDAW